MKYKQMLCIILVFITTYASATKLWEIIPSESTLTFTGSLNGAPTSGEFTSFTGEINFDPTQLNESKVRIFIDMLAIKTSYIDIAETLKTADWFDSKRYTQAVFETDSFNVITEESYQAHGKLTIRDKTQPIIITFNQIDYPNNENKVRVKGEAQVKRTSFGVGLGEWSNSDVVKDEVQVNFTITAVMKK